MFCPQCKQPGKGRFCRGCGAALVAEDPSAATAPAPETDVVPLASNPSFQTVPVCDCGAGFDRIRADGTCADCGRERIPVCSVCGAGTDAINEAGVCLCACQRLPKVGDHNELRLNAKLASVCDRGVQHLENQDWHGLAEVKCGGKTAQVLVICDGVSSSSASAAAAKAAVKAAIERACFTLERGMSPRDTIAEAARFALKAVLSIRWTPQPMPNGREDQSPTCTFVMAIVRDGKVDYGWLGDSRIYWVTADGAGCLVKDHSWINAEIDSGRDAKVVLAEARLYKLSRAIVRSLGSSESHDVSKLSPELGQFELPDGAVLIVCSDGLHVYLDQAKEMAAKVREKSGAEAIVIARSLVATANAMGGCDNVSAAVFCN